MARRAMRPVGELTTEARQIGVERLADRLAVPRTGGDELAQLATTLNSMLARIQAGVEEQQRLFADASHELRGPLAAMRAEIDVSLLADDLDPAASAVLRSAREEVDRLGRTVDDLLTLARADQGALDLRLRALDLATVAAGTCDRLRALARERGITLEGDLQAAPVRGDGTRVGQAVANLVHNAITFSPAGTTVLVRTAIVDGEAILGVIDEGPGIPAGQRERVFDRFSRLDASRTRATGGSGIGLSIVHEIARAHGGRAWTEPAPGRGSAFFLAFPLRADDAAPEEPAGQATTSTASA
jgi:signal transduction histidine kinase